MLTFPQQSVKNVEQHFPVFFFDYIDYDFTYRMVLNRMKIKITAVSLLLFGDHNPPPLIYDKKKFFFQF